MTPAILSVYLTLLSISLQNLSDALDASVPPAMVETIDAPNWIKSRIAHYADKYSVSELTMNKIIECESGFDPKIGGDFSTSTGDYTSWGLVQIHLPAHKNITKNQATDVDFALNFLASHLNIGRGNLWSCYRQMQ